MIKWVNSTVFTCVQFTIDSPIKLCSNSKHQEFLQMVTSLSESAPLLLGEYETDAINAVVDRFDPEIHRAFIIFDVDQTIVDCVDAHLEGGMKALESKYPDIRERSLDKVMKEGGVYTFFQQYPEYMQEINPALIADPEFNQGMPLLYDHIPEILKQLQNIGIVPGMYLTARPREVAQVTEQDLENEGCLFDAPVVTRDTSRISYEDSYRWKLEIIREVVERISEKGGQVIVVDDSSSMIQMVTDELGEQVISLLMDSWERNERRDSLKPICWAEFEEVVLAQLGIVYN